MEDIELNDEDFKEENEEVIRISPEEMKIEAAP